MNDPGYTGLETTSVLSKRIFWNFSATQRYLAVVQNITTCKLTYYIRRGTEEPSKWAQNSITYGRNFYSSFQNHNVHNTHTYEVGAYRHKSEVIGCDICLLTSCWSIPVSSYFCLLAYFAFCFVSWSTEMKSYTIFPKSDNVAVAGSQSVFIGSPVFFFFICWHSKNLKINGT